jgi:hypothetical protein
MASLRVIEIIAKGDPLLFEHIIAEDRLCVIGIRNLDPLDNSIQAESVESLAATLTEDVDDFVDTTPRQQAIIKMAGRLGYILTIDEGMDQQPGTDVNPIMSALHPHDMPDDEEKPAEGGEEGGMPGEEGGMPGGGMPDPNAPPPGDQLPGGQPGGQPGGMPPH